jgi:MoxR-like ATPase
MERLDLSGFTEKTREIRNCIAKVVVGQQYTVDLILSAILADGHILLEGVPGVAKTLMARTISKLIDTQFGRIQFTPDLMPSDVLGTTVFNMKSGDFDFHRGPVFADIVLVDEINRAPAKTQAALFEVMQERQVTIDAVTYPMNPIFTIIATQNPVEQEGTYKLPEAQLDRFIMKINVGYPTPEEELEVLNRHHGNSGFTKLDQLQPIIKAEELLALRKLTASVVVEQSLMNYIVQIVQATRNNRYLFLGASPRASVALMQTAKGLALLQGRDFVTPDDIQLLAYPVLRHRLMLNTEADLEGLTVEKVIKGIISQIEVPK